MPLYQLPTTPSAKLLTTKKIVLSAGPSFLRVRLGSTTIGTIRPGWFSVKGFRGCAEVLGAPFDMHTADACLEEMEKRMAQWLKDSGLQPIPAPEIKAKAKELDMLEWSIKVGTCALCNQRRGRHRAKTLACPIGVLGRAGRTTYHDTNRYTQVTA